MTSNGDISPTQSTENIDPYGWSRRRKRHTMPPRTVSRSMVPSSPVASQVLRPRPNSKMQENQWPSSNTITILEGVTDPTKAKLSTLHGRIYSHLIEHFGE